MSAPATALLFACLALPLAAEAAVVRQALVSSPIGVPPSLPRRLLGPRCGGRGGGGGRQSGATASVRQAGERQGLISADT